MTFKVFVDTDVIIDFLTDRQPFANASSELFELHLREEVTIYISALCINNVYYLIRTLLGHKRAIEVIEELLFLTEVIGTSKQELVQALKNNFKDFEDSVQYSSALKIKDLKAIITRNVSDYRKSEIAVFTPINFLKMLENDQG